MNIPSFLQHKHLEVLRCNKLQKQPKPMSVDQLKFGHQYADYMMDVCIWWFTSWRQMNVAGRLVSWTRLVPSSDFSSSQHQHSSRSQSSLERIFLPLNQYPIPFKVLHYAVEILEGLKAYRGIDDRIRLFRADMNMARMRRSAARAALPVGTKN